MSDDHGRSRRSDVLATEDVRRHSLALVARCVADDGPLARSEIAAATGLSPASVTTLAAALVDSGLLAEADPEPSARRGRRLQKLSLAAPTVAVAAVSIDAERISVIVADLAGAELDRRDEPHGRPLGDPDAVLDQAALMLDGAFDAAAQLGRSVVDVTVVAYAPIGGDPEIVLVDTDLSWGPVDVIGALRARAPRLAALPIHLTADVHAAAAAEFAARPGTTEAIYIKCDSGIGGAALTGGALLRGAHGAAGAFGHVPVVPGGAPCVCGQHGCLATVAGPDVVLDRAGLGAVVAEAGFGVASDRFVELVAAGDPTAVAVWRDAAGWIAQTLGILSLSLDPQLIVVGGFWAPLVDEIILAFEANRPTVDDAPFVEVTVAPGALGGNAAAIGALAGARDRLLADPLRLR